MIKDLIITVCKALLCIFVVISFSSMVGFGFMRGVAMSGALPELTGGKSILITVVDLSKERQ